MGQSSLEIKFSRYLQMIGRDIPPYKTEVKFHPERKWRIDFAWPEQMLAVEIEGGIRGHGRHNQADGFIEDCHKYNAMVAAGWKLLRFTGEMLDNDPTACIGLVRQVLNDETRPVA